MRTPANSAWGSALNAYVTAMRAANRSPKTIKLHRHYLAALAAACANPWAVTTDALREVLARPSWGAEARKSARTVYRGFYRWAHGTARIEDDPALSLAPVHVPPAPPRPTPELVAKRVTRDPDARTRLMAMLAAYAGLRAGEIALVHSRDLDGDLLRVHGKGGRTRVVPIVHEGLLAELQRVDGWAFPGRIDGHLSPGTVSRYLSEAMPDDWTAHTLRHRYGTNAYGGTKDLLAVMGLMGHARSQTTQRYVLVDTDSLRAAAKAAAA